MCPLIHQWQLQSFPIRVDALFVEGCDTTCQQCAYDIQVRVTLKRRQWEAKIGWKLMPCGLIYWEGLAQFFTEAVTTSCHKGGTLDRMTVPQNSCIYWPSSALRHLLSCQSAELKTATATELGKKWKKNENERDSEMLFPVFAPSAHVTLVNLDEHILFKQAVVRCWRVVASCH